MLDDHVGTRTSTSIVELDDNVIEKQSFAALKIHRASIVQLWNDMGNTQ